jgi:hypothetical protein
VYVFCFDVLSVFIWFYIRFTHLTSNLTHFHSLLGPSSFSAGQNEVVSLDAGGSYDSDYALLGGGGGGVR